MQKSVFSKQIQFLSLVILSLEDGIKPDPRKMDAIKTMVTPTSKLELQSFSRTM